jgi:hypothetical protein
MGRLAEAALEIDAYLQARGWTYCIVGGIAIARWGEPRTTSDVDLCLLTGLGDEQAFIAPLLEQFAARVEAAAEFAEHNRVLLIKASNGVGLDVALGWLPFEEQMLRRSSLYEIEAGIFVPTASAEDIVITKAFASRPQDWIDLEGILVRQRGRLEWDYVRRELSALAELKESPQIVEELERIRGRVDAD